MSAIVLTATSHGQVVVESTFQSDADGWTAVTFGPVCTALSNPGPPLAITWHSAGGSPGGFIRTPDGPNTTFWKAPPKFLGNQSAVFGGSMRYEYRMATSDPDIYFSVDEVVVQGAGLTLIADGTQVSRDAWGVNTIAFIPSAWRVGSCSGPLATDAELEAALAQLTAVYIRGEHANGSETNDLDSVAFDATPQDESCAASWEECDVSGPSARWRHAAAVDTNRHVLVLFGGNTGESDTWEFDLATGIWSRVQTTPSPSRRGGHAMVFDAARQRVVMTGGEYLGAKKDVWEYDVATRAWTQVADLPEARQGHSMAFDSARGKVVLYGGLEPPADRALAVLERESGSDSWVPIDATPNPGTQFSHAMAYDIVRSRTVLVGGGGTTEVEVWEWNGATATWEQPSIAGDRPDERIHMSAVYDESRSRVVMTGGCTSSQGFSGTWEFDGASWTPRAPIITGARSEHVSVYDPVHGRVLLLSGVAGSAGVPRDLLEFDGAQDLWSVRWRSVSPGPRDLFGLSFDEIGNQFVLYGGGLVPRPGVAQTFAIASGTLAFDGDSWETPAVIGSPGPRWLLPLVYDSDRRVMMAYGGATGTSDSSATSRLWELDLATNTWVDRGGQPPGQRKDHAAAYDRARRRLVLHGGINDLGQRMDDTWIYNPATGAWTELGPTEPNPGARNGAGIAFDEARQVIVLFGGRSGVDGTYQNSTWEWDGEAWNDVTLVGGNPPARLRPQMVYDPNRRSVLMMGGTMNSNTTSDPVYAGRPYTDLWEWNGTRWRKIHLSGEERPTALVYGNAAYDRSRDRVVYFGGASVTNGAWRNGQTWELVLPFPRCGECPADLTTSSDPNDPTYGIPDGVLDGSDFFYYLDAFAAANLAVADLTTSSDPNDPTYGIPDDVLDGSDFFYYLDLFAAGCP